MGELLAQVIPLALGAAVSPIVFTAAVAVLTGPQPLRRGCAYALGVLIPLLIVTALAIALGRAFSLPDAPQATKAWIDVVLGAVLALLGVRALRRPPAEPKPQPEAQPAADRGMGRYVALGAGLMTTNVTTFALLIPALKMISESHVGDVDKAIAIVLVLAITMALVLIPLAIVAVAPQASGRLLTRAGAWLSSHRRTITVVICFGFSAYLLIRGFAHL